MATPPQSYIYYSTNSTGGQVFHNDFVLKTWRRLGDTPAFEKAGQNFLVRVGNRVPTIAVLRATNVSERAGQVVWNFIFILKKSEYRTIILKSYGKKK
jgi:hypothetical protein